MNESSFNNFLSGGKIADVGSKILVACEESQVITIALRNAGFTAFSCDIQDCSGGFPEWHIKEDVFKVLDFENWTHVIMHPPCTKIAVSGNGTYAKGKGRFSERLEAVKWTQKLWDKAINVCDFVAMENPIGVLNTLGKFPKPQYIQPWQFGHGETKKTGLWLKGFKPLKATNIVEGREQRIWKMPPSEERAKLRSKTYPGIANAIVNQWFLKSGGKEKNIKTEYKQETLFQAQM
jgi:hypothetical protein